VGQSLKRSALLCALFLPLAQLHAAPAQAGGITVASADYGPAAWVPASVANFTTANRPHDHPIDFIVIHDTEDLSYSQTIQEFQNPNFGASAHYVVSSAGQVTQMVLEKDIAWHAGNWDYNTRSIGIEHEGFANVPNSYTLGEYQGSAQVAASICSRWGVPLDRSHVIGHSEVPDPNNPGKFGGEANHTDPGPYWDWTTYMSLAQQYAASLPSPPHIEPDPVATAGDGSVTVSWSGRSCRTPITGYTVQGQPGNFVVNVPGTATSTTITGLTNWTKYTFTVTATNSYGTDAEPTNSTIPSPRLGGILLSDPDVASGATNRLDAMATGTDYALWHRTWDGTTWTPWSSLGGILTSSPAAVSNAANRIDVFGRGSDGALWHRWWDGTAWRPWESLGGILQSTTGPAAASSGPARLDVFVRGSDNALWHRWWNGTAWQSWESLGGILTADPGAVSWGSGRLDVFARGADNALWHRAWDGTTWQAWERIGGYLLGAPAASSCASGSLDVFTRQPGGLWRRTLTTSWGAWQQVDGEWTSGPAAVCQAGTTRIDVIRTGFDYALWWLELPN
jgi:hypothetical protein